MLLENSVSVEGDLLVLDFSLAMEKVKISSFCHGKVNKTLFSLIMENVNNI